MAVSAPDKRKTIAAAIAAAVVAGAGAIGLIAGHEDLQPTAYPDPGYGWSLPTDCFGHTKGVKRGTTASLPQCATYLAADADEAATVVKRYVAVPISQGEFDAYTTFVYNVGQGNFRNSTLLKKLNKGDRRSACLGILDWDYSNGKKLAGLTARRKDEYSLCVAGLNGTLKE